jgi:RNA polymerase sigma-70 factor (ECF subfamily)
MGNLSVQVGLNAVSAETTAERRRADQAAFETLVDGCWNALWRFAYRTTGNRDDAEDLLSEALVEGFRFFGQFRGETSFVRWMYRVMTTTHIDMARSAARRKTESLDAWCENVASPGTAVIDEKADPESLILGPMLSEPVERALAALPLAHRSVVVLADMEQMDYADVSRVLGIPIGTVRSRLHRARAALRKFLAAYIDGDGDWRWTDGRTRG